MSKDYPSLAQDQLKRIHSTQSGAIQDTADAVFRTLKAGGVLHAFGTGHSVTGAMELFHRAGGLVPANGILVQTLSPLVPPSEASARERTPGVGAALADEYDLREAEVLIVFSQSGINSVPIDLAVEARQRGLHTVAVTCCAHSTATPPRHPSGKRLMDVVDTVIDNQGVKGDAIVDCGEGVRAAATSGVAAAFIANWIVAEVIERYRAEGLVPPVYISANVPGGDEHNKTLAAKYENRIKLLRS
jgi:uncharacterized phosphosugar-binding protein